MSLDHSVLDQPVTRRKFIAGRLNAVAGGDSFITFPTLIFTGINPIAANATNNTVLWIAAMASAGAYRKDLKIQKRDLWILGTTSLTVQRTARLVSIVF